MKTFLPIVITLLLSYTCAAQFKSVTTTQVITAGIQSETQLSNLQNGQRIQTVQYFDNLGLPKQSVAIQASPNQRDIVNFYEYDGLNRETVKYLPYTSPTEGNGNYKPDLLKSNGAGNPYSGSPHYTFYNNSSSNIPVDMQPFQQSFFESSPLGRVIVKGGLGSVYQPKVNDPSNDRSVSISYQSNNASYAVLKWTVIEQGGLNVTFTSTNYPVSSLQITSISDPDKQKSKIYKDTEGRTVMTEVLDYQTWIKTYYAYDVFGNLRAILPPELVKKFQGSTLDTTPGGLIDRYAYLYAYDKQDRKIAEKSPGSQWTYYVYDNYDRLVLSQNANQRVTNEWTFTKYDFWSRPILSGTTVLTGAVETIRQTVAAQTVMHESRGGTIHGYTNDVYPNVTDENNYLKVTYYDDYSFKDLIGTSLDYKNDELSNLPTMESSLTKSLLTGSKTKILGQSIWLWTVNYYNDDGSITQQVKLNHKGAIDRLTSIYNFSGWLVSTKITHSFNSLIYSIKEDYEYDHVGRLLHKYHQMGNDPDKRILLFSFQYNELGNVIAKKLYSNNDGTSFFQSIAMKEDIQGKLASQKSEDFELTLGYETSPLMQPNHPNHFRPRYTGDVTSVVWKNNLKYTSNITNKEQGWFFEYDYMGRWEGASTYYERNENYPSWSSSYNKYCESGLTYDDNGNIKTLSRRNEMDQLIDNLIYNYGNAGQEGNQLLSVKDNANVTIGFKDGNATGQDYFYDAIGNLTKDLNKGITLITYNKLNLTEKVQMSSGAYLKYTYDADGSKLYEELYSTAGSLLKRIDYLGAFVYENNVVQFVIHDEGRLLPIDGTNWEYQYILRDHLGNSRMMLSANPRFKEYKSTLETENATIEEANFLNVQVSRFTSILANNTPGGSKVAKLNRESPIGPAISLQVMPGDAISVSAYAFFENSDYIPFTRSIDGTTLISAIAGAFGGIQGAAGEAGQIFNSIQSAAHYAPFGLTPYQNNPAAFINYLVFDLEMRPVTGGYRRVESTPGTIQMNPILIDKPGFVFLYLSNHSEAFPVYFDDFVVQHQESKLAGVYLNYPLGAEVASQTFERHRMPEHAYRYQGKQLQKELGLDYYFFEARLYDPFLGRWFAVDPMGQFASPYSAMGNSPMIGVDPDGRFWHIVIGAAVGGLFNLGAKILSGQINLNQGWGNAILDGAVAFGIGAVAGGVGAATGGAFFAAAGGGALGAGGFAAGAIGALGGAAYSVPIQSIGNSAYFQDPQLTIKEYGLSLGISAFTGGSVNGITASANGLGFFGGKPHFIPITTNGTVPDLSKIKLTNDPEITLSNTPATARVNQPSSVAKDILEDLPTTRPDGVRLNRVDFATGTVSKVQGKLNLYPRVIDPRTGTEIPLPSVGSKVPANARVSWNSNDRALFIKTWYDKGFATPKGGWTHYDIHHITPREYGGTNNFWNLVPVERTNHQRLFNDFWRMFGGL